MSIFKKRKEKSMFNCKSQRERVENDAERYKSDKFKYNLNDNLLYIWNKSNDKFKINYLLLLLETLKCGKVHEKKQITACLIEN